VKPLVEVEPRSAVTQPNVAPGEIPAAAAPAPLADAPLEEFPSLPSDHPAWTRDTLSLSQRARAFVAMLAPIVVRTLTYWDHRVRSLVLRTGTLTIDVSGSYRLE
jgi:hypothetical protein